MKKEYETDDSMEAYLNDTLADLKPSAIRVYNQKAKETPGCISLTLGEPDFDTPADICSAAKQSLDHGNTHYISNNGAPGLLEAIGKFERERYDLCYAPDEIIVTTGATEGLFTSLFGLLNPGDEVIVPTPAFGLYESIITMCRAIFVPMDTSQNNFQISHEMLESALTPNTKAIILNSPSNPTGCILNRDSLENVYQIACDRNIFIICDDVYRGLVYTDEYIGFASYAKQRHQQECSTTQECSTKNTQEKPSKEKSCRDLSFCDQQARTPLREKIIVIQSFSKPYAMTGWRMGYLMADRKIKNRLQLVHQFAVVSASSFSQDGCVEALKTDVSSMVQVYDRRRHYVLSRLTEIGMETTIPLGGFYVFPSIKKFGLSSDAFCRRMIEEVGLAVVPGFCFGSDDHIRLSYCCSDDTLKEGLNRLERFCDILGAHHG